MTLCVHLSEDSFVFTGVRTLCALEWGHTECTWGHFVYTWAGILCVHWSKDAFVCAWVRTLGVHLSKDTLCELEQGHLVCAGARAFCVHLSEDSLCALEQGHFEYTWVRIPLCALEWGHLCVHWSKDAFVCACARTLCAFEQGHLVSTWARTLGVHLSKDTLCTPEWGHFVCTGARSFCVHLSEDNVFALELFRERLQHRVWALTLESWVKHDWAWSPHGWMTIMCLALHPPLDSSVAKFLADSVWNMMHLWWSLCTLYLFACLQVSYCKQLRSLLWCLCDANEVLCLLKLCTLQKSFRWDYKPRFHVCIQTQKDHTSMILSAMSEFGVLWKH